MNRCGPLTLQGGKCNSKSALTSKDCKNDENAAPRSRLRYDDTFPFDSVPPHRPAMPAGSLRGRAPHCLAAGQHPFLSPFTLGPRPFANVL